MVLPVISFVFIALATVVLGGAAWANGFFDRQEPGPLEYVLLGIFYFVAYFIGIFFNAAVVGAATIRLQGGDPSVRDGLRLASSKVGKIAGWAAISATVGLILRSLEERFGFIGNIVISIIGVAWSVVTFFVVPVLLFEPVGVVDGIKRSAGIFRQRWGETFVGNAAIGVAVFLVSLPALLVAGVLAAISVPLGVVVGILAVGLMVAVGSAMTGIFNAALYRFATTGEAPGAFNQDDLRGSFRPKRRAR
ncbi:MAG: DUF6159 family protein [Actinomycetota bacterium]